MANSNDVNLAKTRHVRFAWLWSRCLVLIEQTNSTAITRIFPVFVSFRFVFRALTLSAWNWLPQLWSEHHVVSVGQRGIQTPWKNLKLLCRRSGGGHIKSFNYVTSLYILHTVRVASFCCLMLTFLLLKRPSLCDKAPLYACISLWPLFFSCRKITGSSAPELALSQFYIMNSPLLSVSWEISLNGSLNVFCCRRYSVCRKSLMNLARNVNRPLAISQRRRARLVTLWQSTESLLSEISCTKRASLTRPLSLAGYLNHVRITEFKFNGKWN